MSKTNKKTDKVGKEDNLCAVSECTEQGPCRVFTLKDKGEMKETVGLCLHHFNMFNHKAVAALQQKQNWWLADFLKETK